MIFETGTNKVSTDNYLIPFGKYTGMFVSDLYNEDPKYFIWLFDKARSDLKQSMVNVLKARGGLICDKKLAFRPTYREYFLKDTNMKGSI